MDYCYPQLYPGIHNDLKILRDLVQKLADNNSLVLRHFDNLQNSMSVCSLKINEAQACFDVPASLDDMGYEKEFADSTTDSNLVDCNSNPMDDSDVLTERFEIPVHASLHSLPFASVEVSICCTETVDTPLDTKTVVEENSHSAATKVFDNSPKQGTPSLLSVVSHFRPYRSNDLPYTGSHYSHCVPGVSATNTDLDIVRFNTWMDVSLKFDKPGSAPYLLYHLLETNGLSRCSVTPRHVLAHCVLIHFPFDPGSYKLPTICHLVSSHNFESHISFEGIAQQSRGLVAKLYVCESVNGVAIGVGSSWDEALEFNEYARGGTHGAYEIVPADTCIILLWKVDSGLRDIDKYLHNKASTFSDQHFFIPFSFNPDASMLLFTPGESALAICVWDPGICSTSFAITGYIENRHALPMLGSTAIFCLIAYSSSMTKVWDPGRQQCVHSFILQFDSDVSVPKSSTSGLFFNDGGELSPEIILPRGKKLFILLLPLYAEHQVRQSDMNTYEKYVLTVIPEAFGSSLTDSCFRGILGARSYNEGGHTFSNGSTVGYIYIALIAIKPPLPSIIVDLQANQNDRFNIVEVVNKLFLKEVHAYSSKVLLLGCILLEDILYIRLMTPQTMNHLVGKAEHFAVHMLQALSKSWPTNSPNRQLQVKINVERSSSRQFMDTIIVLTKSKSFGWNTYNSTLLQEVQGFAQLHRAKLDKHLWRIFRDSSLFPFDPGGFLHIQFNSKRKMSDTRLNAMISVLFSNLEDKVLIRHGGIVMNENSYSFVEGILENLTNYLWDPG